MAKALSARQWRVAITGAALLMLAAKIAIDINTYGSIDALTWEANLQALRYGGAAALYRNGVTVPAAGGHYLQVFNHPPFLFHLLSWWGALADVSGLPLRFWLRLSCAAADLGSLFLLAGILRRRSIPFDPAGLLLVAVSPVSLMVSGFHGKFLVRYGATPSIIYYSLQPNFVMTAIM